MTIGDVLGVVFGVVGLCLSGWALLVGLALLFPARSARAQNVLQERPWHAFFTGAALTVAAGGLALVLINQPNGLGKLAGLVGLAGLLGVAAMGASGLACLLGERLSQPESSRGATIVRGAGVLALSLIIPVPAWFTVLPLAFVASLGAGWLAMRPYKKRQQIVTPAVHQSTLETESSPPNVVSQTALIESQPNLNGLSHAEAPR